MDATKHSFWQIKIIMILISHYNLFPLGYSKIDKKQKFSAFDIVESQSKC